MSRLRNREMEMFLLFSLQIQLLCMTFLLSLAFVKGQNSTDHILPSRDGKGKDWAQFHKTLRSLFRRLTLLI